MKNATKLKKTTIHRHKQFLGVLLLSYLSLALLLPFLMGKQMYFRESRSNLNMVEATTGIGELTADSGGINQLFVTNIQRLKKISVLWATYNRENIGTVYVELYRQSDLELLAIQTLSASEITNGYISELELPQPLEGLAGVPLMLRLSSPDAVAGSAVSPMMNTDALLEDSSLSIGGRQIPGTLCFAVTGEDYIWTGLHYWEFAVSGAVLLLAICGMSLYRVKRGKSDLLFKLVVVSQKYRFLIRQLVNRDFKTKYKRSVLGVLWSFLNPLLTMLVQYLVFSNLFRFEIPYYPVYLLTGVTLFNFFSEASTMTLSSIVGNAALITKVYVPKYIYPVTRTLSSLVNLLLSLIPLLIVMILSGLWPTKAIFLLPFPLLCLMTFSLGVGLILASSMVFFRDTQFLWGVLSMIWMYLTPLFYPASILPKNIIWVLECNPLYYFVTFVRTLLIEGISPEPIMYVQCTAFALGALFIGGLIFKKSQDRFVLYL